MRSILIEDFSTSVISELASSGIGDRNMLKRSIPRIILALLLSFAFSIQIIGFQVSADAERVPGVKAGDWAKYDVAFNYTTNDPNPPVTPPPPEYEDMEYYIVEVLSVAEADITYEARIRLKNGTEWSFTTTTSVIYGYSYFFIAANLTAGDPLYSGSPAIAINATLLKIYAGATREVNYLDVETEIDGPYGYRLKSAIEAYWDRATGILDDICQYQQFIDPRGGYVTETVIYLVMMETNLWSAMHVPTEVHITPKSLNLESKGKWIMARIETPEGCARQDIEFSTIMLNNTIPAEVLGKGKARSHLTVRFDRESVTDYVNSHVDWSTPERTKPLIYEVTLTVTGMLNDGTPFEGSDTIRMLRFLKGQPQPQ